MKINALIKRENDYAIRICAFLASKPKGKPIPVSRLTELLQIKRPFTNKIIFRLRRANILGSVQGRKGGVFLLKDPAKLSVMEILNAMNFNSTLNECVKIPTVCPLIGFCKIHSFFFDLQKMLFAEFEKKKILELAFYEKDLNAANKR